MTDLSGITRYPRHVAIIMDGNGRWALERNMERAKGHEVGADAVRTVTEFCAKTKAIEQLTLFAFSVENWKRPEREVSFLMKMLKKFVVDERKTVMDNSIVFKALGRLEALPADVLREIRKTEDMSANNGGMKLVVAVNYGGRQELTDACKRIAAKVLRGELVPEEVDEKVIAENLYQPEMPDVDLLVRTAGEMRVSNFLLWQMSYAELYVTPVYWPEFGEKQLIEALRAFHKRERRFGAVAGSASSHDDASP